MRNIKFLWKLITSIFSLLVGIFLISFVGLDIAKREFSYPFGFVELIIGLLFFVSGLVAIIVYSTKKIWFV